MHPRQLNGKGLFVFSDPGGAKPILAMIELLKKNLCEIKIISDRVYPFYKDFTQKVLPPNTDPAEDIKSFAPNFIFTGTSYTSNIECSYIKAGKDIGIKTFSFVDHRTFIINRFLSGNGFIFPDYIFLIDEVAKKIAIQEGISEKIIFVIENPYHWYLRKWKPRFKRTDFLQTLGILNVYKKIFVFAPDPLSNINGKSKYGFDEIVASKLISNCIGKCKGDYILLLKCHPNQKRELLTNIFDTEAVIVPPEIDTNHILYYADVVIGFFSSILIEAELLGVEKIIRFLPEGSFNDPFNSAGPGIIVNEHELCAQLINLNQQ